MKLIELLEICRNKASSINDIINYARGVVFEKSLGRSSVLKENEDSDHLLFDINNVLRSFYLEGELHKQRMRVAMDALPYDFWRSNYDVHIIDFSGNAFLTPFVGDYIIETGGQQGCVTEINIIGSSNEILQSSELFSKCIFRDSKRISINLSTKDSFSVSDSINNHPTLLLFNIVNPDGIRTIKQLLEEHCTGYCAVLIVGPDSIYRDLDGFAKSVGANVLLDYSSSLLGTIYLFEQVKYPSFCKSKPIIAPYAFIWTDVRKYGIINTETSEWLSQKMYNHVEYIDRTFFHSGACIIYDDIFIDRSAQMEFLADVEYDEYAHNIYRMTIAQ